MARTLSKRNSDSGRVRSNAKLELLPCPFCGANPDFYPANIDITDAGRVVCAGCGAQIALTGDDPREVWNMRI